MPFVGEAIAIATVLCWTVSIQFFGAASKEVGAIPVNIIRIFIALILFGIFLFVRDGALVPIHFPAHAWLYLSLSGIVGFFIGDIFLFKALVELGPRVAMLIHSLAAPTAAIIGWLFLNETYILHQWIGIFVTLLGVAVVILEKNQKASPAQKLKVRRISFQGVVFGFAAMLGQAVGYVLSKAGMQIDSGYLDAFAATQIRAIAAFFCFVLFFTITNKWGNVKKALTNTKALTFTAIGAFIGPFLGVSLSLLVLHYLTTGVASTFLSLVPICIIPFSIFLHKEHVSIRAFAGAVTAVFGIYLLMS
ncbi:MAG: DMT family transporter [Thermodesulfobacteriota bacterium]|nr:DMT family transporter [Thermodesulfobacteriota bacterium]